VPESGNIDDSKIYKAYGVGIKEFQMRIFDRWGSEVFQTRNLEDAWNGSLNNTGPPMPAGLFAVRIVYKGVDGEVKSKISSVMLIR
jgi:hypothetical protein